MPTPQRRCSTCRHFQPAPLWRKGWCRNPLLYTATQNHLVDERDLDCNRQLGDYWEPVEAAVAPPPPAEVTSTTGNLPPIDEEPLNEPGPPPTPAGPRTRTVARPFPPLRRPGTADLPERGPADYLRLAMPVVLILVVLVGYAIWTGLLFRDAAATANGTPPIVLTVPPDPSPTGAPTVALSAVTVTATVAPRPTSPPLPTVPPTAPAATPTAAITPTPAGLRVGGAATVDTGAGNDNLRLRRDPGRTGVILRSIKNGERVTLVEGPREVDGQTWWKVEYAGEAGWVAASFIRPAP